MSQSGASPHLKFFYRRRKLKVTPSVFALFWVDRKSIHGRGLRKLFGVLDLQGAAKVRGHRKNKTTFTPENGFKPKFQGY